MAISINWETHVINVPKAYLTPVSGTIYSLDTNTFRLDLKALESSEQGIPHLKTHIHNTAVTVAGTTFARTIEILSPYSIEFEDGQYTVILQNSNNNIFDVANGILVQNQVQIISTNSAGLITVVSGSGVTEQDKLDIADKVWVYPDGPESTIEILRQINTDAAAAVVNAEAAVDAAGVAADKADTAAIAAGVAADKADTAAIASAAADENVRLNMRVLTGRWTIANNQMIFYDEDDLTPLFTFDLFDAQGNPTMTNVFDRRIHV